MVLWVVQNHSQLTEIPNLELLSTLSNHTTQHPRQFQRLTFLYTAYYLGRHHPPISNFSFKRRITRMYIKYMDSCCMHYSAPLSILESVPDYTLEIRCIKSLTSARLSRSSTKALNPGQLNLRFLPSFISYVASLNRRSKKRYNQDNLFRSHRHICHREQ